MVDLFQLVEGVDDSQTGALRELRLNQEPAAIMAFTSDVDVALLHYEIDEAVRGYVPCPGTGCPSCFLGSAPQRFGLLPVLNVESREVEVLRIPTRRSAGSLAAALLPLLKDSDISDKVVMISRQGSRFTARSQPLAENGDRCASAIEAFLAARKDGLKLVSAFPKLSAAELAEVERVRRKLAAVGGYVAPKDDGIDPGSDD